MEKLLLFTMLVNAIMYFFIQPAVVLIYIFRMLQILRSDAELKRVYCLLKLSNFLKRVGFLPFVSLSILSFYEFLIFNTGTSFFKPKVNKDIADIVALYLPWFAISAYYFFWLVIRYQLIKKKITISRGIYWFGLIWCGLGFIPYLLYPFAVSSIENGYELGWMFSPVIALVLHYSLYRSTKD